MTIKFVLSAAVLALLLGCQGEDAAVTAGTMTAENKPVTEQGTVTPSYLNGQVTESFDANGYTYVQVNTGEKMIWAAGPATNLNVGQEVNISTQMPMSNFHSKALGRDFEILYFVNRFKRSDEGGSNASVKSAQASMTGIEPLADGQTVAGIWENKQALSNQRVRVRGKVTKFTPNIMGMNWLHIQDSSSNQDLTITTKDKVSPGDLVIVDGSLTLNKDYGAGYFYELIIEEARIELE